MLEFLKKITGNGKLIIEYNNCCNSNTKEYTYKEIINKYTSKENLYFCTGILNKGENRGKKNIGFINRLTIDIDLRKEVGEITDEEIIQQGITLGEFLKEDRKNDFGQWSYIIMSGNGLHIHYLGDIYKIPNIELFPEYYKEMTEDIYKEFNKVMGKPFICDFKVGDLGHLFRLPGTINNKDGIKKECRIISQQNIQSDFVNKTDILIKLAKKRIEIRNREFELQQKKKQVFLNKYEENIFEKIRKEVDVAEVLLKFIPERRLQKDNKNFIKPGKKGNNSYFVDRQNNIIIRNGSTFLSGSKEGLNPIDLVEEYTGLKRFELVKWFKENKFIS